MRGNERYVLGRGVEVEGLCIIPVIRIFSITSHQLGFVTADPKAILIREGEKKFRIALEDHLSWEKIVEVIPEVDKYRDLDLKNDDEDPVTRISELEWNDQDPEAWIIRKVTR